MKKMMVTVMFFLSFSLFAQNLNGGLFSAKPSLPGWVGNLDTKSVTDYYVIESQTAEGLTEQVNQYIRSGYQPLGTLIISFSSSGTNRYIQAMVKYNGK